MLVFVWAGLGIWLLILYGQRFDHFFKWPQHLATSAADCIAGPHEHLRSNAWLIMKSTAAFALLVTTTYSLGRLLQRLVPAADDRDQDIEAFGLGAIALHFLMFGAGLVGLWYAPLILGFGLLVSAVGVVTAYRGRLLNRPRRTPRSAWHYVLFFLIALAALEGLAPDLGSDAGLYHVGVPSTWLADHAITFLPGRYVANLPLPQSMFYGFLLAVGPTAATGLFQPALLLLAVVCVGRTVRRYSATPVAFPLAGFALLAVPALNGYLAIAGNDQLAVAFFALGLHFGLRAVRETDDRGLIIALAFVGFGMSTKYTAVVYGLLLTLFIALQWKHAAGSSRTLAVGLGVFFVPFGTWGAKAWLQTGNPVFPAFSGVFGTQHSSPEGIARAYAANVPRISGVLEHLTFPLQVTLDSPTLMHNPGVHWVILLPVALVLVVRTAPKRFELFLSVAGLALGWAYWALFYMSARYSAPLFVATAVAVGIALARTPLDSRIATGALGLAMLWATLSATAYRHDVVRPYTYLCGQFSEVGYATEQDLAMTVHPEHGLIQRLNAALDPEKNRVLLLGEDRTGGLRIPHAAGTRYDGPIFDAYVKTATSARSASSELREHGFTHLAINVGLARFYAKSGYGVLSKETAQRKILTALVTHHLEEFEIEKRGEHDWFVGRIRETERKPTLRNFTLEGL